MIEEWRDIPSWPGYQASSLGRIRRVITRGNNQGPRMLKGCAYNGGYRMVQTTRNGRKIGVGVHALVCEAFHGPRRLEAPIVRHLDNSRDNNRPDNLAWGTYLENAADRKTHLTERYGRAIHTAKLCDEDVVAIFRLSARGMKGHEIAPLFSINRNTVNKILSRQHWSHVPITEETLTAARNRYRGRGGPTGLTDEGHPRHG